MRIGSQPLSSSNSGAKPASAPGEAAEAGFVPGRDGLSLSSAGRAAHAAGESEHPGLLQRILAKIEHFFEAHTAPDPAPKPVSPSTPIAAPAPAAPVAPPPPKPVAPANPAVEMRRKAESVWFQAFNVKDSSFRAGRRDAADVNATDADRDRKAAALVQANAPVEAAGLQKLSPAQQAQYQHLSAALDHRPQVRLALQLLLAEGKLTGGAKNTDGANLLSSLDTALSTPPHPAIDPTTLVGDMIQEIAVPSAINQQDKTTCTVTSVQMLTAMQNPAEYVRVVAGLASPAGAVALADGETLDRKAGTEADDGSNRSASSRLWQAAFSQFAVGPNVDFDNNADARSDGKWGIFGAELDHVVDALTNRDNPLLQVSDSFSGVDMLREVGKHANAGHPVPVCLDWGERDAAGNEHPGHDILVTRVANDQVYYNNPWGTQESMPAAEFVKRAWWANPIDMKNVKPAAVGG